MLTSTPNRPSTGEDQSEVSLKNALTGLVNTLTQKVIELSNKAENVSLMNDLPNVSQLHAAPPELQDPSQFHENGSLNCSSVQKDVYGLAETDQEMSKFQEPSQSHISDEPNNTRFQREYIRYSTEPDQEMSKFQEPSQSHINDEPSNTGFQRKYIRYLTKPDQEMSKFQEPSQSHEKDGLYI